jgi:hypothetical protein
LPVRKQRTQKDSLLDRHEQVEATAVKKLRQVTSANRAREMDAALRFAERGSRVLFVPPREDRQSCLLC